MRIFSGGGGGSGSSNVVAARVARVARVNKISISTVSCGTSCAHRMHRIVGIVVTIVGIVVVRTSDQYFSHRSNEGPISVHRRRGNLCNNQSFAMSLVYHLAIFVRLYLQDDPLGTNTAQKDQNPKFFETTPVAAHDIFFTCIGQWVLLVRVTANGLTN